mgnify:CR=1 FL=1
MTAFQTRYNRILMMFSFLFHIVPNLPVSINDGSKALPKPTNDGVLHIWRSNIYQLDCTSESCSWTTLPRYFTSDFERHHGFVAMYIPEGLTECSPPLTTPDTENGNVQGIPSKATF